MRESKENWSNRLIAHRARVSESLVRLIKQQIGFEPTAQIAQSLDGREIDVSNIGSSMKFRKEITERKRQNAKTKRERLKGLHKDSATDLDNLIHRCEAMALR
jgi:hypothetical protein